MDNESIAERLCERAHVAPARARRSGRRWVVAWKASGVGTRRFSRSKACRQRCTRTARLRSYLGAGQREENGVWADHFRRSCSSSLPTRAGSHPQGYLRTYKGYLQADAYIGSRCSTKPATSSQSVAECVAVDGYLKSPRSKASRARGTGAAVDRRAKCHRVANQPSDTRHQICGAATEALPVLAEFRHGWKATSLVCRPRQAHKSVRLRVTSLASADSLHRERYSVTRQQRVATADQADCFWRFNWTFADSPERFRTVHVAEGNTG